MKIKFENKEDIEKIEYKYAIIFSRYKNKWVYCKHIKRNTWEIPAGTREIGESILETAKRELFEETGAVNFTIYEIGPYSVEMDKKEYGFLFFADIVKLEKLPNFEIEKIEFFDREPRNLTYPIIQKVFFKKAMSWIDCNL